MNTHEGPDRDASPLLPRDDHSCYPEPAFEIVDGPLDGRLAPLTAPTPSAVKKPAAKERSGLLEAFVLALIALVLALTLKTYVAEAYEIKGRSMEPTFATGQRVVVLKAFYDVERYDIIVFSNDEDPYDQDPPKDLIKRVIGLPGDEVEVKPDGRVYLNRELLDEGYTAPREYGYDYRDHLHVREVPQGQLFVLGDNRPDSHDSRDFSCIPASSVRGKVVIRWWPFGKLEAF